jgi:hypothetical protein
MRAYYDASNQGNFYSDSNYYDANNQGNFYSDINYIFIYIHLNSVMAQIASDEILTASEKNYIKGLYNFTGALIKSHEQVIGHAVGDDSDYEKFLAFKKKVLKGYESFSKSAQTLLEKPEYRLLVNYQGDFGAFDVEHAEMVCKNLMAKVDKNQVLKYDDRNEVNLDTITFKTFDDKGNVLDGNIILSDKTEYDVRYQKSTREVTLSAGFTTYPYSVNQGKNEETLNQMAQKVAKSINENAVLISQKKSYDEKGKRIRSIQYVFTQKINGIQDVSKNIEVIVEAQGLISQIKLTDTD